MIKLGYNTYCHWLKERLYESTEHRTELKLSHHLPNRTMSDLFRDFFLAFLSLIKVKFRNKRAKVCKNARRSNLRYCNVSRDKNPQR